MSKVKKKKLTCKIIGDVSLVEDLHKRIMDFFESEEAANIELKHMFSINKNTIVIVYYNLEA